MADRVGDGLLEDLAAEATPGPWRVGDRVRCDWPGSWVDGKVGTITALNVVSSDNIRGHQLKMADGVTIIAPACLELVSSSE